MSLFRQKLHIVIVSAVFGILVWFSVAMSDQYQVTVAAPLAIDRIPEGRAIRTPVPPALQLKLRGTGWHLASLLWTSDIRLVFPMQVFHGAKRTISFTDVAERVAARPGVQLVDMSPESVYVDLDRVGRKTVPVVLDCQISFRDGYGQVGPTVVTPESVTVTGAESLVRMVDGWSTVHGVFDNLKAPVEANLALMPSTTYVLALSVPSVQVKINVEPFAEKTLSGIPVDAVAVAPNRELILIPPKIDLVIRGGIRQLSNVIPEDFRVSVNYRSVLADTSGSVEADVQAPPGIQVVSKKPDRLQYVVRKRL